MDQRPDIEGTQQIMRTKNKQAGFSLIELVIVITIMLIVAAFALPNLTAMLRSYRAMNDARGIAAQLSLARMRAASESAPARLNFNLAANSYQLEVCTSLCNQAGATYLPDPGTAPQVLSQGVTFGAGGVANAPAGLPAVAQSALIIFNSRGISVDAAGAPIGTAAIYITNNSGAVCAVTVSIGGQPTARLHQSGSTWRVM
jgi:prepilin-type N-terminal cleavage/methylation domain-containing protein